jgi:hypothetical protein
LLAVKVPPVAALATMGYGLPNTVATAGAPTLVKLTDATELPFCKPVELNSLPLNATVCPKTLVALLAVMLSAACVVASVPLV